MPNHYLIGVHWFDANLQLQHQERRLPLGVPTPHQPPPSILQLCLACSGKESNIASSLTTWRDPAQLLRAAASQIPNQASKHGSTWIFFNLLLGVQNNSMWHPTTMQNSGLRYRSTSTVSFLFAFLRLEHVSSQTNCSTPRCTFSVTWNMMVHRDNLCWGRCGSTSMSYCFNQRETTVVSNQVRLDRWTCYFIYFLFHSSHIIFKLT